MNRDMYSFLSGPFCKKSSSGKTIPFFFLNLSREDIEKVIGEHVRVVSSDIISIVSALKSEKPVCIEDLDLAPPGAVDDIVRLMTSDRTVVATASERLLRLGEGGLPDQVRTTLPLLLPDEAQTFEQLRSGLETGIRTMAASLNRRIAPLVASVIFFSESGVYNISGLSDERAAILDQLRTHRPKYVYTFNEVLDQCMVDLKTYYGPEKDLPALRDALTYRVEEAKRKDEETASTPLEVSRREHRHAFRDWFLDEMGLQRDVTPDLMEPKIGGHEMVSAFKAVHEYFRSFERGDSIPSSEPAKESIKPLIAAYRSAVSSAGDADAHPA